MILAIDFDGTCVSHEFPEIGEDIGAAPVLQTLVKNGHKIILFTMRSGKLYEEHNILEEAKDWFRNNEIPLYGVNINPHQHTWTESTKPYAHCYIDDAALGIPLAAFEPLKLSYITSRPFVYWYEVIDYLLKYKFITENQYKDLKEKLEPYKISKVLNNKLIIKA